VHNKDGFDPFFLSSLDAALQALGSSPGTIYLPPVNNPSDPNDWIRSSGTIELWADQSLVGTHRSVIGPPTSNRNGATIIRFRGSNARVVGGLGIYRDASSISSTTGNAIDLYGQDATAIEAALLNHNIGIYNSNSNDQVHDLHIAGTFMFGVKTAFVDLTTTTNHGLVLRNCLFMFSDGDGVKYKGSNNPNQLGVVFHSYHNVIIRNVGGTGLRLWGNNHHLERVVIDTVEGHAIHIGSDASLPTRWLTLANASIANAGVRVDKPTDDQWGGAWVINRNQSALAADRHGFFIDEWSKNVDVRHTLFLNNAGDGIRIKGNSGSATPQHVRVVGCEFISNGAYSPSAAYAGIHVLSLNGGTVEYLLFTNNRIYNDITIGPGQRASGTGHKYGIWLENAITNAIISVNDASGAGDKAGYVGIQNNTTGSGRVINDNL